MPSTGHEKHNVNWRGVPWEAAKFVSPSSTYLFKYVMLDGYPCIYENHSENTASYFVKFYLLHATAQFSWHTPWNITPINESACLNSHMTIINTDRLGKTPCGTTCWTTVSNRLTERFCDRNKHYAPGKQCFAKQNQKHTFSKIPH